MSAQSDLADIDAMPDGPAKHLALQAWNRAHTAGWQEPPAKLVASLELAVIEAMPDGNEKDEAMAAWLLANAA